MELIIYTDEPKYAMHCLEYEVIWNSQGSRIQEAFEKILSLPFKEESIKLLINAGYNGSNSAGDNENEIMHFRYNNRCKIGTFLHELSHRIVMEYSLFDRAKEIFSVNDIHEVIDLFLYDVIVELYGEEAAKMRVEYESNFEEEEYRKSWEQTLAMSYEERQEKLKKIIERISNNE